MATCRGFSLIQLLATVAIVAVLGSVAVPSYHRYIDRARVARAIGDLGALQIAIERFELNDASRALPARLTDLEIGIRVDPWGNPYSYLVHDGLGQPRTDRSGDPINTDYDLYSRGPDGDTAASLLAVSSDDDIVRGNDGAYVGVVSAYPRPD